MTQKIGIILTTFNKLDLTKECLKSLVENTKDYELVVVDNMSNDGTREWLKEQNIHVIEFDEWVGVSTALNAGIRYFLDKETDDKNYDICWIHNDMTFYPNWLEAMKAYLVDHPECARVACHNMRDPLAPERPGNELPFLIRGQAFKIMGLFDERYKGACGLEDWDINNRILENNWTVMITPEARVYHKGAATRTGMCPPEWEAHNHHLYLTKWGSGEPKV